MTTIQISPLDKRKKTELHFGVAVIETFQNDPLSAGFVLTTQR